MSEPIFLIGFMATGKTTLGEAVAKATGSAFFDLDLYIEDRLNQSIGQIFSTQGEEAFRKIEHESLQTLIRENTNRRVIISLGGGTVCRPGIMAELNETGMTVYLEAPVERIVERLMLTPNTRPLVSGKTEAEVTPLVEKMLRDREAYYKEARLTFDSSRLENTDEIEKSASEFIEMLKRNSISI